ncbi:unnamed protein product [Alopecurus aequalis]
MADQAAMQQQAFFPDDVLGEIFVRLPRKEFHMCRCLSRAWATTLSSGEFIDRHLRLHGKIRLDYDDIMLKLVLYCCDNGKTKPESKCEISVEEEGGDNPREKTPRKDDDGGDDEEGMDWREEYRTRGYVEVDTDYYIRRAEIEAWAAELWAQNDFSRVIFTESDDEDDIKLIPVPYGTLNPRIRQPLLLKEEETPDALEGHSNIKRIRGREKTEEEVDQEIIAFLRRLRSMDPQPQFLRKLDSYRWLQLEDMISEDDAEPEHDLVHSDHHGEVDIEDPRADS